MSLEALKLEKLGQDDRLDLRLEDGKAVITLSSFTDGIGWTTQKTLRLDGGQLEDLHRMVAAARCRLKASEPAEHPAESSSRVIEFPSVS